MVATRFNMLNPLKELKTMKAIKLFSMAAVALILGACSNDDNEIQQEQPVQQAAKIPFEATISVASDVTRTTVTQSGDELLVAWKGGEEIALVHNGVKDVVTVSAPNTDGTATISGTITAPETENEEVILVYPAGAVASVTSGTTYVPNTDASFLAPGLAQDGTLNFISLNDLDGRQGSGTLVTKDSKGTLNGNVTMVSKTAIWELNLTDGSTSIDATSVTLKLGVQAIASGAVATGKSQWFICVVPATLTKLYALAAAASYPTPVFTIEASDGTNTYTYTKTTQLTLATGKYYRSTVTMTKQAAGARAASDATAEDLGKLIGADGNIYADAAAATAASTTAAAMIAYVGEDTDHATYKHGLAIALADESGAKEWSPAKTTCAGKSAVTGAAWMLPSVKQWKAMFKANGGDEERYTGLNTAIGNAGGTAMQLGSANSYWSSDGTDGDECWGVTLENSGSHVGSAYFNGFWSDDDNLVRACLAF